MQFFWQYNQRYTMYLQSITNRCYIPKNLLWYNVVRYELILSLTKFFVERILTVEHATCLYWHYKNLDINNLLLQR